MVYVIFVRKKNHQVIHEIYRLPGKAIKRFEELSKRFPEVSLDKKRRNKTCKQIEVI